MANKIKVDARISFFYGYSSGDLATSFKWRDNQTRYVQHSARARSFQFFNKLSIWDCPYLWNRVNFDGKMIWELKTNPKINKMKRERISAREQTNVQLI